MARASGDWAKLSTYPGRIAPTAPASATSTEASATTQVHRMRPKDVFGTKTQTVRARKSASAVRPAKATPGAGALEAHSELSGISTMP